VIKGKLLESEVQVQQAANNTKEQFARRNIDNRFLQPIKKLQIPLQQISSEPALSLRFRRIEPMLPTPRAGTGRTPQLKIEISEKLERNGSQVHGRHLAFSMLNNPSGRAN